MNGREESRINKDVEIEAERSRERGTIFTLNKSTPEIALAKTMQKRERN